MEILKIDLRYCNDLANILSTDFKLHKFLGTNEKMAEITGNDYYKGCLEWEDKRNACNFCILYKNMAIGSISYVHENLETASFGMWIASEYWNMGLGTDILKIFMKMVKENKYMYLTGSIQKCNLRSKRMCEKCGAIFKEDEDRWYPTFKLKE